MIAEHWDDTGQWGFERQYRATSSLGSPNVALPQTKAPK